MSLTTKMKEQKDAAAIRENTRKRLFKNEREYRAAKYIESWSRIPKIGAGLTALPLDEARNTAINLQAQATMMSTMNEAQLSSNFSNFTPENMLRLVRLSMPNTCRNKVFTEFAMESARDSIKYIKPIYRKTQSGELLNHKHTAYNGAADEDEWDATTDVSKYQNTDINEDNFLRATYETTEDRFTSELMNIDETAAGVFTIPVTSTHTDGRKFIIASRYIDGYTTIYDGDETHPVAVENKVTGTFFISKDYSDTIKSIVMATAEDGTKTLTVTPNATITVDGVSKTVTLAAGKFKAFARFDLEDDFEGDNLGEVELVMSDYKFQPRPTTIGVTWSQLSEITLDASFGVSAQDLLVTAAGDAIRINLDARAFKYAYNVAKSNKGYTVEFDAGYAKSTSESMEGYFHTAQTFPSAVNTVEDVMLNDINRGGVSRMVAGTSAGSYLNLVKGTFTSKGRQPNMGIHQIGEFGGIPTFKAPSSIIPTDEILCVWKNDQNEGDVAIAFGTLIPFFNTGIIQRKQFYKEAGLASYGDYALMNRRYLAIIKINNLKDTTANVTDSDKYSMAGFSRGGEEFSSGITTVNA